MTRVGPVSSAPGYQSPTVTVASELPSGLDSAVLIVPVISGENDEAKVLANPFLDAEATGEIEVSLKTLGAKGANEQLTRVLVPSLPVASVLAVGLGNDRDEWPADVVRRGEDKRTSQQEDRRQRFSGSILPRERMKHRGVECLQRAQASRGDNRYGGRDRTCRAAPRSGAHHRSGVATADDESRERQPACAGHPAPQPEVWVIEDGHALMKEAAIQQPCVEPGGQPANDDNENNRLKEVEVKSHRSRARRRAKYTGQGHAGTTRAAAISIPYSFRVSALRGSSCFTSK